MRYGHLSGGDYETLWHQGMLGIHWQEALPAQKGFPPLVLLWGQEGFGIDRYDGRGGGVVC